MLGHVVCLLAAMLLYARHMTGRIRQQEPKIISAKFRPRTVRHSANERQETFAYWEARENFPVLIVMSKHRNDRHGRKRRVSQTMPVRSIHDGSLNRT